MNNDSRAYENYLSVHYDAFAKNDARKKKWLSENYGKYLPDDTDASILEIGPGYGELLDLLVKDYGYKNVYAIDVSKEVVVYCNSVIPDSTKLVMDTEEFLATSTQKYDVIFMLQLLEHIPKHKLIDLLTAAHHSLKNNGKLIIEVPNMLNPLMGLYMRYADFSHEVGFTVESLNYVLKAAGFNNTNICPVRLPTMSFLRGIRLLLQRSLEFFAKIILQIYTRGDLVTSQYIYAIASKK